MINSFMRFWYHNQDVVILSAILILLIVIGLIEHFIHNRRVKKVPVRIHVNGTRGKSTTTRLIAAGLREAGLKVIAKTTGTAAMMIYEDGSETPIVRRKPVNISEQFRIVREATRRGADAIVIECMALHPENQWVSEHKIIRSTIGVITNVADDHLDVMGPTEDDVARALSATVPKRGVLVTENGKYASLFEEVARKRKSEIHFSDPTQVSDQENEAFSYVSFKENVSIALKVCELCGIDRQVALNGMVKAAGDPGAMKIIRKNDMVFAGAFAANDSESTKAAWDKVKGINDAKGRKTVVVMNNRQDRVQRIGEIASAIVDGIAPDYVVLVGGLPIIARRYLVNQSKKGDGKLDGSRILDLTSVEEPSEIVSKIEDKFSCPEGLTLFGVGNTKGIGESLMEYFEKNGEAM